MKLLYTIQRNEGMLRLTAPPDGVFMTYKGETEGQKLERFLVRAEMQQKELAAKLGVDASYVSRMVKDRIGWVRGQYFGQIASILRLKPDEIHELNPAAVVNLTSSDEAPGFKYMVENHTDVSRPLPDGLIEAIQKYGHAAPDLLQDDWQQFLGRFRPRGGDKDADDWYDFYRNLVKFDVKPGDPN